MRVQHWQDIASLLLGLWLTTSPLLLGFTGAAGWVTVVLGVFVVLFAIEGLIIPSFFEEWGEILLGVALMAAPWAIGYESQAASISGVMTGVLIIALAVWEMMTDREFMTWWHEHWHHPAH
jgi:hypothetical protein